MTAFNASIFLKFFRKLKRYYKKFFDKRDATFFGKILQFLRRGYE